MTEDIFARLAQVQRHTRDLQAAVNAMLAQAQPSEGRGTDPSGCVAVVVGPDGLPSRIEVNSGWQRQMAPEELGSCVLLAYQQAAAEAMRAWSESFDSEKWKAQTGAVEAGERDGTPPPPVEQVQPYGSPRDTLMLTEEALTALKATREQAAAPSTSTGWGGNRAVSVTLTRGGLHDCTIDPQWALRHGATAVNAALSEALREARAALEKHAAQRKADVQRLDDLAREALATLARFQDLIDVPKER